MNELEELVANGHFLELSKDGDRYVAKLFNKKQELSVAFGRGDSLAEAVQILVKKKRELDLNNRR